MEYKIITSKNKKIKLYKNQKLIIVNKAESNKTHLYCVLNLKELDKACNNLQSKAGVKLYLYLAKNQHKYTFALSGKEFEKWAGVSKSAYDTSVKELIELGYLQLREGTDSTYDFFESGRAGKRIKKPEEKNGFEF